MSMPPPRRPRCRPRKSEPQPRTQTQTQSSSSATYSILEGGLASLEDPTGQGNDTPIHTQAFRDHAGYVWAFRAWIPAGLEPDLYADNIASALARAVFQIEPRFQPRPDAVVDAVVTPEGRDEATSGYWYQIQYGGEAPLWTSSAEPVAPKVYLLGMLRDLEAESRNDGTIWVVQ
ncbi:hypothetical protein BO86DRAFT_399785 [Aspergillus japonicus CBS 114.51]|uniref:Uncharacterized protein n=1 Tax=Aspergillus japonicus CBS 114.51 TaxID=1448312 RepID=A0A8T8X170_ASPJA|nr:hypothetical protein BO86DRAFT_399785 [Aspergillus japonicus CBS 114.51]RAH81650.1 hypothetical protein BO86DRAFT_399785 [Aspergillus japonicus CBS 114.51]